MSKLSKQNFGYTEFPLIPGNQFPDVSPELLQTLARLLAWDAEHETFRFLRAGQDGRLIVSSEGSAVEYNVWSKTDVSTTALNLIPSNPDRVFFMLQHQGGSDLIRWQFNTTSISTVGFMLQPLTTYIDYAYKNNVWVRANTGTQGVLAIEAVAAPVNLVNSYE